MTVVDTTFRVVQWNEAAVDEIEAGPKLVRAHVTKRFAGGLNGESKLEYLMMYAPDGTATFVGLERVSGRLLGKTGTFVIEQQGMFRAGTARAKCMIVPASGTGELEELKGHGELIAEQGKDYAMTLEVSLGDHSNKSSRVNPSGSRA